MNNEDQIVFEVFMCNNPMNGHAIYCPVYNWEIKDYSGKYWNQLSQDDQREVKEVFNS